MYGWTEALLKRIAVRPPVMPKPAGATSIGWRFVVERSLDDNPWMTDELRKQLVQLLRGTQAHMSFDDAMAQFPAWAINQRAPDVTYTPWHLVEHLRITQWDMLRYIEDPTGHVSPDWPVGYWPDPAAETDTAGFARSIAGFKADLRAMEQIALDESRDLTAVLDGTPGHTPLRGLMIIGNHNSYHLGEFASLRQVMGSWPEGRG